VGGLLSAASLLCSPLSPNITVFIVLFGAIGGTVSSERHRDNGVSERSTFIIPTSTLSVGVGRSFESVCLSVCYMLHV